jgi:predicted membrane protein (TIGR00267 family)
MHRHHYREAKFLRRGERLRDFVFGYNDGAITTIAVLTVLSSASIDSVIVILGALANIFGSSISLAFSDYISTKTQIDIFKTFATSKKLSKHEKDEAKDISSQFDKPIKIVTMTTGSFMLAGFVALTPFLFMSGVTALVGSMVLTLVSVFFLGMVRARYTHGNSLKSGFEMLVIALLAMVAAYLIGKYVLAELGVLYA